VSDHNRGHPRGEFDSPHRRFDESGVAVDRSEDWLEVDSDKRYVGGVQSMQPTIPESAIADEAMDEDQPPSAMRSGRDMIFELPASKRLPPAEYPWRRNSFTAPGREQLCGRRAWHWIAGMYAPQKGKFDRQNSCVGHEDGHGAKHSPSGVPRTPLPCRPGQCQHGHSQRRRLLELRQHQKKIRYPNMVFDSDRCCIITAVLP
jgi:hypothetical protein